MKRYLGPSALLLGILSAAPVGAGPDPATDLSTLAKQRRDAARKTYQTALANYRDGFASEELLYRWSLRWLEAEREVDRHRDGQVAAFRGHWERMRQVEKTVKTLHRARVATIDRLSAAEYYRVEAEMWLLQAQEKRKNP